MEANTIKVAAGAVAGMLAAFLAPLAPYALLCTVMVLVDMVSAWQLGRRMRRKGVASAAGRLSSRRFGRVVGTLAKCYGALAVAALMQKYVVEGMVEGFDAVRGLTGLICFWQLMSILENESTCSDARWAKVARRYLADKANEEFLMRD